MKMIKSAFRSGVFKLLVLALLVTLELTSIIYISVKVIHLRHFLTYFSKR